MVEEAGYSTRFDPESGNQYGVTTACCQYRQFKKDSFQKVDFIQEPDGKVLQNIVIEHGGRLWEEDCAANGCFGHRTAPGVWNSAGSVGDAYFLNGAIDQKEGCEYRGTDHASLLVPRRIFTILGKLKGVTLRVERSIDILHLIVDFCRCPGLGWGIGLPEPEVQDALQFRGGVIVEVKEMHYKCVDYFDLNMKPDNNRSIHLPAG